MSSGKRSKEKASPKSDLTSFFYYEKKKPVAGAETVDPLVKALSENVVAAADGVEAGSQSVSAYYDYSQVGTALRVEDNAKKKETSNPSYFRFPMVFRC